MAFEELDFWEKEWPVITGAPHLVFGGLFAIIVLVGSVTWFFVNWSYRHRIAVFEDRLKLADERVAWFKEVKDEVVKAIEAERQFKDLRADIIANIGHDVQEKLAEVAASVKQLSAANSEARSAIAMAVSTAVGMSESLRREIIRADREGR
jgi:hypothetical protein